ncbi:prephenate dehydratase [Terriglobus tenax]|uniref:prephenate dehydratase n=1 Tax=Terriglobus tenax TaxID=1111115 RepID=UPI0021DFF3F1|nr:prephenate dehydratase domain-containing protein [Terriglobus tenax]
MEKVALRVAIQGERGSNSHAAAVKMLGEEVTIVPCALSAEVVERLAAADGVDVAVLPIENTLHGSVADHYDLLFNHDLRVEGELLLRIQHNVMAAPGVKLSEVKRVLSHPVALSQCRRWLAAHREIEAVPFYDTAGSVKHLMATEDRAAAAIASAPAAPEYGAEILEAAIEDNPENYTRFLLVKRKADAVKVPGANKISLAFSIAHRPGTLVEALRGLAAAGVDLTKIESRPVPGKPWEYLFYVDLRFTNEEQAEKAVASLAASCDMVREMGRYLAA